MKRQSYLIYAIALMLTVTSCHIYKPYSRQEIDTEGLYREQITSENDSASLADISWSDLFTDTNLQLLIEKALENNFDLRSAMLTIEQAEAMLRRSKAAFAPTLSAGLNGNYTIGENHSTKTWNGMLNTSWEIDIFGKLLNSKRAAKAALMQSEAYKCAVQTRLIANVATLYYTLLTLDEQLKITEATLGYWKESVKTMELLMQAGMVNQAAVVQSRANRYGIETTIPDLKRQIQETENALSVLLGRLPGSIERGTIKQQQFPQVVTTGVPSLLLANRPDVKQAESELMIAYAQTNIARSMLYPSVVISANGGYSNSIFGAITNPAQLLGSVAGGLTQPIFNGLALTSQLKVTKKEEEKAVLAFEKTLLNAGIEVSNALFNYQILDWKIDSRGKQIEELEKSVEYTQELLKSGSSNYLEVLTSQQALLSAQIGRASDTFEKVQSIIKLYAALGGGSK